MINIFNNKQNISYYDNIDEFVNHMETSISLRYNSSHDDDYSFTGTYSFEEACDLCKYGDKDLQKQIHENMLDLDGIDTVVKKSIHLVNDVVGFIPNVANYVMGIPTNMIRDSRKIINSKIINIFINVSAPAYVDKNTIRDIACKYVAAINQLELEGYRCNVYSGCAGEGHNNIENLLVVKIKSDKEPLNLAKMAFPMCHPSMLRRLKFKWMETIPINFGEGYGTTISDNNKIKKLLDKVFNNKKMVILNVYNYNGSVNAIKNKLRNEGKINE